MKPDDPRFLRLSRSILEVPEPDWDAFMHGELDEYQGRVVQALRTIRALARLHDSRFAPLRAPEHDAPAHPVSHVPGEGARPGAVGLPPVAGAGDPAVSVGLLEHSAAHIADYRIIRKIGEGGMGLVFEAEQQHPRRLVALKVTRGGPYVDDIRLKMFHREAQSLARLKHPGIAAIYDSGHTNTGEHYFAMELVRGRTLGEWLHARSFSARTLDAEMRIRLGLFCMVCDAVAYAHQRGVVHRDVKPSNIVVLPVEAERLSRAVAGVPDVKILDFGLARITDSDVPVSTIFTEASVQGTLQYMSPEQARGNPDEIDVRTDVYSLGVILYELVTGGLPYDVAQSGISQALYVICEVPPRPFARTWKHSRRPDRELETIALKALDKEPSRRYQSVSALAEDVGRYLAKQPILARPPSTAYQIRKLVARHRVAFASAVSLVVFLAVVAVGMTLQASIIARERDRANQEAQTAQQVSEFLEELFAVTDPGEARGNTITAREILDKGASRIRAELRGQPEVQTRLMGTIAGSYRSLGLLKEARPMLEEALRIRRARFGDAHPDVATAEHNLGDLLRRLAEYEEARRLLEHSLATREKALGPQHPDVAASLYGLADMFREIGDYEKARPLCERALRIREASLGPEHPHVASTLNVLGLILWNSKDYKGAQPHFERALRIWRKSHGSDHSLVAVCMTNLANVHSDLGDNAAAMPLYEGALAIQEKVLGPEHPEVAETLNNIGYVLWERGDYKNALPLYQRSMNIFEKRLGSDHPRVATSLYNIADVLRDSGDYPRAQAHYERALKLTEAKFGPKHEFVAEVLVDYAKLMRRRGREDRAEEMEARVRMIRAQ